MLLLLFLASESLFLACLGVAGIAKVAEEGLEVEEEEGSFPLLTGAPFLVEMVMLARSLENETCRFPHL